MKMKKVITAILIGLSFVTFGRGIEGVETQTINVNFRAKQVSGKNFKAKGVVLLKKLIHTAGNEFKIKPALSSKRIGLSNIRFRVQYSRLGKVLVRQVYELNKQRRELFIRTVYYYGYSDYKLQLDGVNQTYEHNPDITNINNSNSNTNTNNNSNRNTNRNTNNNRNSNNTKVRVKK